MNSKMTGGRTGAQLIVDALALNGVKRIWNVPGESFLGVLDALVDEPAIEIITCRHESGAGFMAEAEGKLTGRPGICFTTRGPGVSNATIAIHTAAQDSTPTIFFVGGIARGHRGREAFQEWDVREIYGSVARWATNIDDAARIPEIIHRAFHEATAGRGGPVVIGLPEDMLSDVATPVLAAAQRGFRTVAGADELAAVHAALAGAERPMIVVGGTQWSEQSRRSLEALAAAWQIPVACAFRRQDRFDNTHPQYTGFLGVGPDPVTVKAFKGADVVLLLGSRITDPETDGYQLMTVPTPQQRLIHVHPDHRELGKIYVPEIAVHAGAPEFVAAFSALPVPPLSEPRRMWAQQQTDAWASVRAEALPPLSADFVDMTAAMRAINAALGPDAIVTTGAGNFTGWVQRFREFRTFPTMLGPQNGAMGYGVPSAIAASIVFRDRAVVGFSGDGDFLMTSNEIATAMQYDAAPILIVVDNGMYGTIRMHQEREHPGRVSGTRLTNPDFAAYAHSFGAYGENVTRTEDVIPALERARASKRAAVIALRTNPEQITARMTIQRMREPK